MQKAHKLKTIGQREVDLLAGSGTRGHGHLQRGLPL